MDASGPRGAPSPEPATSSAAGLQDRLHRVTEELSRAEGVSAMAVALTEQLRAMLDLRHCCLFLYDPEGTELSAVASATRPAADAEADHVLELAVPAGRAVTEGRTFEWSEPGDADEDDARIAVPLSAQGRTIGVLDVGRTGRESFEPADVELLEWAARLAGPVLWAEERVEHERDLARRFRNLIERIPVVTYIDRVDEGASSLYMSPQVQALTGFGPHEWLADPDLWLRLVHPDDRDWVRRMHLETNRTGEPFNEEYRLVTRSGRIVWVSDRAQLVRDEQGSPLYWQGTLTDVNERRAAEAALREGNAVLNTVIEGTTDPIFVKDLEGHILLINEAGARALDATVADVLGKTAFELFPEDEARAIAERERAVIGVGDIQTYEEQTTVGGVVRTFLSTKGPYRDEDGRVVGLIAITRDITERKRSEEEQVRRAEYLSVLHDTALAAMRRLDDARMLDLIVQRAAAVADTDHAFAYLRTEAGDEIEVKAGAGLFTGWLGHRMVVGEGLGGQVVQQNRVIAIDDYDRWEGRSSSFPSGIMGAVLGVPLQSGHTTVGVIGLAHVEPGRTFSAEQTDLLTRFAAIASVALDNVRLYAALERELGQRERAEEELSFLAFHDHLTGLPNRTMFEEVLGLALARSRRHDRAGAILYVDLDGFKRVNDSFGHPVGDEVLREVAHRLRRILRETDVVARQGGDEFLVLVADLEGHSDHGPEELARVRRVTDALSRRIGDALAEPFLVAGSRVSITASVGVAVFPHEGTDGAALVRLADLAMYRSKGTRSGETGAAGRVPDHPS